MLSRLGAGLVGKGLGGELFGRGPKPAHLGERSFRFLFVDDQGLVASQVECSLIARVCILASHSVEASADGGKLGEERSQVMRRSSLRGVGLLGCLRAASRVVIGDFWSGRKGLGIQDRAQFGEVLEDDAAVFDGD
jgi:hypothetical protein